MAPASDARTTMRTILITLRTFDVNRDVELPGDAPIQSLLPLLIGLCGSVSPPEPAVVQADWWIGPIGGEPFDARKTLIECNVVDGAILQFEPRAQWLRHVQTPDIVTPPIPVVFVDDGKSPQERTKGILPSSYGTVRRMGRATKAFFSLKQQRKTQLPQPQQLAQPRRPSPSVPPADGPSSHASSSAAKTLLSPNALTIQKRPSALERVRQAWRTTNYLYLLDQAIVRPQLHQCATIAVVSPKGGVGKTTITALLGTLLAAVRRDRIVAIDTNPDFGSLGRTLTPDHQVFVDDVLSLLDNASLTVTTLDANLGRAAHGLMVLPAPTDPLRMAKVDEAAYLRVVNRLKELVGVVVLDCGTGLQDPASRAALHTADQIVLVSDSQPATASLVAEAASLLEEEGKPMWLVVNKMPRRGSQLDMAALGAYVPKARGLLALPADSQAANRISNGTFEWLDAPYPWQQAVRELAVALTAEWNHLQLAR